MIIPDENAPEGAMTVGDRSIDEYGGFKVEIPDDRTAGDLSANRPSSAMRAKILSLPDEPGVYMYLDRVGKVIYVGKAKRLKRRVSSYFNRIHPARRTNLLVHDQELPAPLQCPAQGRQVVSLDSGDE